MFVFLNPCVPVCIPVNAHCCMHVYACVLACQLHPCPRVFVRTVQSAMVMCFAAVLASTSASSSLTLFSTDISRGLFSAGMRRDSYLQEKSVVKIDQISLKRISVFLKGLGEMLRRDFFMFFSDTTVAS